MATTQLPPDPHEELHRQINTAIQRARGHNNQGARDLLVRCWHLCEPHIEKPVEFDATLDNLLDAPEAPENFHFGGLQANLTAIEWAAGKIEAIETGKVRPDSPAHAFANIDELRASLFTDLANAERLRQNFGQNMRHVTGIGWLDYTGSRWEPNTKAAKERAAYIGTAIKDELHSSKSSNPEHAKAAYSWARKSESANGIAATLTVAEQHKELNGDGIEWDADKWALNTKSGTINLRTGAQRNHQRDDYLTTLAPTNYDPKATAPRFERFLLEVFGGDTALVDYLQWAIGHSLTGDTSAQVFFLLHGQGANGKSTLLDVLRHVLGPDYFHTLTFEDLLQQQQSRHLSPLAQLRGKRLVMASEAGQGRKLNAALIKSLTGGDPIRANLMRQDAFEFVPVCKLWLLCNHRPTVADNSLGMWRRVRLLPFLQSFTGDKADPQLAGALKAEATGILAWAVRGAIRHAEHGEPAVPECVRAATDAYRLESDTVAQFIAECCTTWEHGRQSKTELYTAYSKWANGRGMNRRAFADAIREHGFTDSRIAGSGREAWAGLRLTTDFGDDCEPL